MRTTLVEQLSQRARRQEGSLVLRVNATRVSVKWKARGSKAEIVTEYLAPFDDDCPVDMVLRALAERIDFRFAVAPITPRVDPEVVADNAQRAFLAALTLEQRGRLTVLLDNLTAFKAECLAGWSAGEVEPALRSPRSCLQPCAELNQCGPQDDDDDIDECGAPRG